jgi:amino acid adenylation domain-containing protein
MNSKKTHKIPLNWNQKINFVPRKNFFQLFKTQVNKNSKNIAVVTTDGSLTYEELNTKSNKLAKYLRSLGVKKNSPIGLSINSELNLIVGILGILKSGGVYLPLDPSYPKTYLKSMLKNAKPKLIITQSTSFPLFCKINIPVINLDKEFKKINNIKNASISQNNFESSMKLDDLAYIIYTSGSTGKPKGIMISHRSLPNIALSRKKFYPNKIKALISGGICFDASILVIFYTLLNGGCLYLSNYELNKNIRDLRNFIKKNSINFIISVPSLYSKLLENLHNFPKLKTVSLTGESIPYSLCLRHSKLVSNAILYNEYGPSEYAIGTTIAKIYDPFEKKIQKICVGKPLINTQVYILDENLKLVSSGSKGEIHVAGVGLAKGYLNNKSLTNKSFIPVSFSNQKQVCLYKTGDLGRFLPNGNLEFLGRINNQYKICNYKINLGEIEHAILQHPKIKETVVFANENSNELIAYITTLSKKSIENDLKNHLVNILPNYMIPSKFVHLNQFPLSANGKIDKKALLNNQFTKAIESIKKKIIKRGDLPHVSVKKQLKYVDNLSKFPLGRFLIEKKYFDSFWTHYVMISQKNTKISKLSLEHFILNRSPLIKGWKELFKNFQKLMQERLRENITLASIPCGLMQDMFLLDYSNLANFIIIGIDIDPNVIASARKLSLKTNYSKNVKLIKRDAWKLQFSSKLDLITSCGLNIYESNKKKLSDLYSQFYKALKPGGTLITGFLTFPPHKKFSEWNLKVIKSQDLILEKILFEDIINMHHHNFKTSKQFKKELEAIGFKKIEFLYDKARVFPVVIAHKPT